MVGSNIFWFLPWDMIQFDYLFEGLKHVETTNYEAYRMYIGVVLINNLLFNPHSLRGWVAGSFVCMCRGREVYD